MIAEHFRLKLDEVEPHMNLFDDLDADSLDSVELVLEVEKRFDVVRTGSRPQAEGLPTESQRDVVATPRQAAMAQQGLQCARLITTPCIGKHLRRVARARDNDGSVVPIKI